MTSEILFLLKQGHTVWLHSKYPNLQIFSAEVDRKVDLLFEVAKHNTTLRFAELSLLFSCVEGALKISRDAYVHAEAVVCHLLQPNFSPVSGLTPTCSSGRYRMLLSGRRRQSEDRNR